MSEIRDKRGVLECLPAPSELVLDIGCGPRKSDPLAIGVDLVDSPSVDIVGDAQSVLARLPDASVGRIVTSHCFEHLDDLEGMVAASARVLMDGGQLDVTVPHFSNPYFYSDPTHRHPFGLYTFSYYARSRLFHREVPRYGRDYGLELLDVRLAFSSNFKLRRVAKRGLTRLVNASRYAQELYEEHFAYLLPCYDVRYWVRRLPRSDR